MGGAQDRYRVVIAGGGVAALEAMVALRALAEERVDIELLAADRHCVHRPLSVAVPSGVTWPLPLYALAIQTAARLEEKRAEARILFFTPEEEPLAVFGREGSGVVSQLLADHGIELLTKVRVERFEDGLLHLVPGAPVAAERAVALP